jgi:RNA polymerase primary sigma factor
MPSKSKHAATSKKSLKDHRHTKPHHIRASQGAPRAALAKPSAPAHPAGSGKHPEQTKAGAPLAESANATKECKEKALENLAGDLNDKSASRRNKVT